MLLMIDHYDRRPQWFAILRFFVAFPRFYWA